MPFITRERDPLEDLSALYELAKDLLTLDDPDALLDSIVLRSLAILGGDRGFLVMKQAGRQSFKVIKNWSADELLSQQESVSRTLVEEVFARGELVHLADVEADPRFGEAGSVMRLLTRSVLAAPLSAGDDVRGVLYLESRSNQFYYGAPERELFGRVLALCSKILEGATRRLVLERRNNLLERDLLSRYKFPGIITRDPAVLKLLETAAQVADSALPVLVQGPSGTGKELVARAVHLNSPRHARPFLTINCSAISPALLESELFGHVKGAFTGATQNKVGLIAAAHGGTLFLDEVGELPRELQAKLLRTLQFGEVTPVGSTQAQTFDVRFVAATNRDLEEEVREGTFREDLLYRLNAVVLELPSLRARPGDILPLFHAFVARSAEAAGRSTPLIDPAVEAALVAYHWPGNIRELENEAKRAFALTPAGSPIALARLSPKVTTPAPQGQLLTMNELERQHIELHLKAAGGNRTAAAQALGVSREGLRKMLIRHKIS
ncbi:MAG: sigma-54-dependent Fis family transcriptional regulator [Deltaproteobacteria bacterium]|nr:sigma-54-dependent Fis family transcriptional regulator [Deltaproteobacteria bacterium]